MNVEPLCMGFDRSLPTVPAASITCDCGQTLETILQGELILPPRHYPKPTKLYSYGRTRHVVRSNGSHGRTKALCPVDRDTLITLIYRAQRAAAGIGTPRLLAEEAVA